LGFDASREIDPSRCVHRKSPVPIMLIQAEKDEIGDVADVRAFFAKARDPKQLIILPGASRLDAYRYPAEQPDGIIKLLRTIC
jgi:fermentation-respiration switch protein FrsA (DUF1100 family)